MDETGYLDRLYVHKDYQGQGIASAICDELERFAAGKKITTHASITAKPFFQHHGYCVVREQKVIRRGVALTNFVMEKQPERTKLSADSETVIDVIELSQAMTAKGIEEGLFEPIDLSKIENSKYLIGAAKKMAEAGQGVAYTINSIGIMYNP